MSGHRYTEEYSQWMKSRLCNALQMWACFSYNPKVFRTKSIPGAKHSGVHRKKMQA
jgi:hypothetical protein